MKNIFYAVVLIAVLAVCSVPFSASAQPDEMPVSGQRLALGCWDANSHKLVSNLDGLAWVESPKTSHGSTYRLKFRSQEAASFTPPHGSYCQIVHLKANQTLADD